ncbi:MAG: hypothetical protein WB870_09525 [Gallionellaceae bacterium]
MRTNSLREALLAALKGTDSRNPARTEVLYALGARAKVEAELLELYRGREIGRCVITRDEQEVIVWWAVGACLAGTEYGARGPKPKLL